MTEGGAMSVDLQPEPVRTEQEFVQYEVADRVATIWLNRPEEKNCVTRALLHQFGDALERAERDPAVRVTLIRARGHPFGAGADLQMLAAQCLGTTNNSETMEQVSPRIGCP